MTNIQRFIAAMVVWVTILILITMAHRQEKNRRNFEQYMQYMGVR